MPQCMFLIWIWQLNELLTSVNKQMSSQITTFLDWLSTLCASVRPLSTVGEHMAFLGHFIKPLRYPQTTPQYPTGTPQTSHRYFQILQWTTDNIRRQPTPRDILKQHLSVSWGYWCAEQIESDSKTEHSIRTRDARPTPPHPIKRRLCPAPPRENYQNLWGAAEQS